MLASWHKGLTVSSPRSQSRIVSGSAESVRQGSVTGHKVTPKALKL